MQARQRLNGLHFDDYLVLHDKIESIPGVDLFAGIDDRQGDLSPRQKPARLKFVREAVLIGGFQKAWSKGSMYLESGIHHVSSQPLHCCGEALVIFVIFVVQVFLRSAI